MAVTQETPLHAGDRARERCLSTHSSDPLGVGLLGLPSERVERQVRTAIATAFPAADIRASRIRVTAPDAIRQALGFDLSVSLGPVLGAIAREPVIDLSDSLGPVPGAITREPAEVGPAVRAALMTLDANDLIVECAAEGTFLNLRVDHEAYLRCLVDAVDRHRSRMDQDGRGPLWRVIAVGDKAADQDEMTVARVLENLDRIWLRQSPGITSPPKAKDSDAAPKDLSYPAASEVDRSGLTDSISIRVGSEHYLLRAPDNRPTELGVLVGSVLSCAPSETVYLVGAPNEGPKVARVMAIVHGEADAPLIVPASAGPAWSDVERSWSRLLRAPSAGTLPPESWDPALATDVGFGFVRDLAGLLGAARDARYGDASKLSKAAQRLTSHFRGPLSPGTIGDVSRYVLCAPDPAAMHA